MSSVDFSRYEILIPFAGELSAAEVAAEKFNAAKKILFNRVTPKKNRELEIKKFIAESVKVREKIGGEILIEFGTKITPDGTVKPVEVLKVLRDNFGLQIEILSAKINRTALLCRGRNLLDVVY